MSTQPSQAAIRDMMISYIGDGQSPNMFFVTVSPYVRYKDGDWGYNYKLADGATDEDFTYYGPFMDYATARKEFDEVDLYGTEASVTLEDRLTGTIAERYLEEVVTIEYSESCDDDAKRFGYE